MPKPLVGVASTDASVSKPFIKVASIDAKKP
jgi:hypothetical protein